VFKAAPAQFGCLASNQGQLLQKIIFHFFHRFFAEEQSVWADRVPNATDRTGYQHFIGSFCGMSSITMWRPDRIFHRGPVSLAACHAARR
jgi:hypothetical protein